MASKLRITGALAAFAASALLMSGCTFGGDDEERQDRSDTPQAETQDTNTDSGSDTTEETPEEEFQEPEDADVFSLAVGDCITDADMYGTEVSSVPTVPCSQPHTFEVFYEEELPDGDGEFPGEDGIQDAVMDICYGQSFTDFVGVAWDSSELDALYLAPTQGSWDQGDRLISCLVYEEQEGNVTTGTLEGANR
ncbi:septum formation family protein [Gulosibacter sp. 10]|uniref:septum formation family protein n=1 Tax=Gulosibacter sp. 10 TaxID=1255570 RepID=UPI00097F6212|nr:septum formation family protein [Gulosibacter sp. 10]SJM60121.1 hypothetical protein FM112_06935 [Gulosibacter sp. 10]